MLGGGGRVGCEGRKGTFTCVPAHTGEGSDVAVCLWGVCRDKLITGCIKKIYIRSTCFQAEYSNGSVRLKHDHKCLLKCPQKS